MMVRLRLALLLSLVALLLGAHPASASPTSATVKNNFTYVAEAAFLMIDAAGIETLVNMAGFDHVRTSDEVFVEISRYNPECLDPNAGCPPPSGGSVRMPVAEEDVRIQPDLNWAHVSTTVPFVDTVSGTTCTLIIDLTWAATIDFIHDGGKGQGFRRAEASGTLTCAGEELLGAPLESSAQLSRYMLLS
jgi:hypothetical protein